MINLGSFERVNLKYYNDFFIESTRFLISLLNFVLDPVKWLNMIEKAILLPESNCKYPE
jgi:hypothetical protein